MEEDGVWIGRWNKIYSRNIDGIQELRMNECLIAIVGVLQAVRVWGVRMMFQSCFD